MPRHLRNPVFERFKLGADEIFPERFAFAEFVQVVIRDDLRAKETQLALVNVRVRAIDVHRHGLLEKRVAHCFQTLEIKAIAGVGQRQRLQEQCRRWTRMRFREIFEVQVDIQRFREIIDDAAIVSVLYGSGGCGGGVDG